MNKSLFYAGIPVSISLTLILVFTVPFAWTGIIASLPLLGIKRSRSVISGLIIGFFVPFFLYFLDPIGNVMKLSTVMSGITHLPSFFLIIAFPLLYCLITGASALLWNIIFNSYFINREKPAI